MKKKEDWRSYRGKSLERGREETSRRSWRQSDWEETKKTKRTKTTTKRKKKEGKRKKLRESLSLEARRRGKRKGREKEW